MKSSLALAVLILAIGAGLGWHDSQQLAAIRQTRDQLVAEAAARGIVVELANPPARPRTTRPERENRQADAKLIAAEFIAFGREREAFEKAAGGHRDEVMQKQMVRRMTDLRDRMMALDPAQLTSLIAEVRASPDLSDEVRKRLVAVAVLALANDHPQAVLELFTGTSELAKDDVSGGYVVSSSLARWAKDDPQAALAWVRQHAASHPDLVTDDAKRGLLSGAAIQDPRLAFRLIGELGLKDPDEAIRNIVSAAQTPDERSTMLAALREHLATLTDAGARDAAATANLTILANGVGRDGFAAASQWLAAAKLSPAELAGVAAGLNYDTGHSGETGQWIEWLGETLPSGKSAYRIQYLVASWTYSDSQAAGQWLAATPDGPAKNTAIRSYAETISRYEPETAAQWALTLPVGSTRDETLRQIYQNWPRRDPAAVEAAAAFAQQHGIR
ncbi:MAG: hypothetical protein NTW21_32380 [Verrucomicrobia bacterium]|nr:hypothetical protein [Verrucomicrobiota bacterium]